MKLLRFLDRLMARLEEVFLASAILLMSLLLIVNVLMRVTIGSSVTCAEELGQILLTVVTFVGISYVARHGKHIRMSIFYDLGGPGLRKFMATLVSLVTSLTLYWLTWIAYNYMTAIKISHRVTPALGIPVWLVTCVVVLGFFSAATQYAHIFYLNLAAKESFLGTYPGAEDESF